jgi:uncharacterized LabA/DUF88 family protein
MMGVYKIWDSSRQQRKSVFASTLQELKARGSEKLGFEVASVVLENDGTEVDGDKELLEFAGSTLMCLKESERWSAARELTTNSSDSKIFVGGLSQDSGDDCQDTLLCSDPQYSEENEECVFFIDDSNIFIECQKCYAKHLKLRVQQDPRCRIDIGKLLDLAQRGRKFCCGDLFGSEPPAIDTVWIKIREKKLIVHKFHKNAKGKEKEVDVSLVVVAMHHSFKHADKVNYQTIIIVAGDRDYCTLVEDIAGRGWKVEILAFASSLSESLRSLGREKCCICTLDERNVKDICFEELRWKKKGRGNLPRDRTKVLEFRNAFDLTASQKDEEMLKQLTSEITSLTLLPCVYSCCIRDPRVVFIIGCYRAHQQKPDFFDIWTETFPHEQTRIKSICDKICSTHEFVNCLNFLEFCQKQPEAAVLEPTNKFDLPESEKESDLSDDAASSKSPELLHNDPENHGHAFTTVVKPSKPVHRKYSECCKNGFECPKGNRCSFSHTTAEKRFFKVNGGIGCRGYKTIQCRYYQSHTCKHGGKLAPDCRFYHSQEDKKWQSIK